VAPFARAAEKVKIPLSPQMFFEADRKASLTNYERVTCFLNFCPFWNPVRKSEGEDRLMMTRGSRGRRKLLTWEADQSWPLTTLHPSNPACWTALSLL
jgi:hypothetical protein